MASSLFFSSEDILFCPSAFSCNLLTIIIFLWLGQNRYGNHHSQIRRRKGSAFKQLKSEQRMKLSSFYLQPSTLQLLLISLLKSTFSFQYNMDNFKPLEYLDFELINGDKSSDLSRNRYDLTDTLGVRSSNLPVLSRGVREIEDLEEFGEDTVNEPSCSELRKMWRIARRLHKHAIKVPEAM